ncbi:hypothetical protein [Brachybacterium sp. GPGPB12]|uniref:hypothetical protein n=1 Tax=Brachybacterium sp. GPGPB12 TaxID=3023517 RepID=UPI003134596A
MMAVMVLSGLVGLLLELFGAGLPLVTWTGSLTEPGGRSAVVAVMVLLLRSGTWRSGSRRWCCRSS